MTRSRGIGRWVAAGAAALAMMAEASPSARADEPDAASAPVDEATQKGRAAYERGKAFTKDQRWDDALGAFLEAERHRDAPLVQYSIGYCLRALGRYVAAQERFARALADPNGLTPSERESARAYLGELDRVLVRVQVTLDPPTAALAVDGRPLRAGNDRGKDAMLASVEPPGAERSPGKNRFLLVIEAGPHLFVATRQGHQDAVVHKAFAPGQTGTLKLDLELLPARVAVESTPVRGIVKVDGREVGVSPIEFERVAGKYQLEVVHDDYEPYALTLNLAAGQRQPIAPKLVKRPLVKKWWFWTSVVAGAAAVTAGVTYAATRRPPPTLPANGGTLNWVVGEAVVRW